MRTLAPHNFTLDAATRIRGLNHVGDSSLIDKLESGLPVTIAIIGASVALNAGCFAQPGRRCMHNNGRQPVAMLHGEPRMRPFKGFLVRWFEWLNATWPHPQHRLINAAGDATSMSTIVPCLFSHLPSSFDLLFVEGGSMFLGNTPELMEAVARKVLSMRSRPDVAFVTTHYWCRHGGSTYKRTQSHGQLALPVRTYRFYANRSPTAAVRARAGGFEAYVNASRLAGKLIEQAGERERGGRPSTWKKGATTYAWSPPSWASLTNW